MKKIHLLYLLIFFAGFLSCEDDYVAPNSFSDVSWYSVVHDDLDTYPIIGQGDYYSISDISQGAIEHKWELLDSAIYFLGGTIVQNDSTLQEKIISGGNIGDISTDKTVHLYFPNGGIQSVRLYNTFDEEVTFVAKDTTLTSVYDAEKGVHVFDHTFTVDVYFDVVAAYKVYRENGDSIDFTAADTIQIDLEPGDKLSFAQKVDSIYHITDVQWTFPKGVPTTSTADSVSVTFYSPGVITGIKLRANRSGNNIPTSVDIVEIPLKITVADGPFMPVDITKVNSTSVKVQLSGVAASTPLAADFTVTAKNADLGKDFDIAVSSVSLSDDKTNAILTLAAPIYSNDEVEVTYSGTTVKSSDGRTLQEGTVVLDVIIQENLVTDPGFENGADTWMSPPSFEGGRITDAANYSTDMAKDGSYSMHAIKTANGQTAFANTNGFVLEQGVKYTYSYEYYAVSSSKQGGAWEARISELLDTGNVMETKLEGSWTGLNAIVIGSWTTRTHTITGDGKKYTVAMLFYGASSAEVYFDNFSITVNDSRPSN